VTDFERWMTGIQARMEGALARRLPPADALPARLHDAMRYAVLGGGKRVRPLLVHGAGELAGASAAALEAPACAVELIHAYSLVHDDLPCMDDDVLRRGKPTVHVEFDYATALLAGDALQTRAFDLLAEDGPVDPGARLAMVATLAQAAGSRGMCGGQQIDLDAVGKTLTLPELEMMHIHKTGALIRAAVRLGALAGAPLSESENERLDHFAKAAGLLFQVVDDILDATADTATLGKTAGKDAAADKPTYVSLMGLGAARAKARDLLDESLSALSVFGARAGHLSALARFIAERSF
jgi:farnesyl diphosphate synthase